MIIYKATNKINGKNYIGKTINTLEFRKSSHENEAKIKGRNGRYFIKALSKYGNDNFEWEEIDKAESEEELNYLESYWIKFYNSNNPIYGYNLSDGGEGGKTYVLVNGEKILSARFQHDQYKSGEKINTQIGKPRSEESKRKQSKSRKGKFCGNESWRLGTKHTQESKKKMSESQKGVKRNGLKIQCVETQIIYDSITEAGKLLNICRKKISKVCDTEEKAGNLTWRLIRATL